MSYVYMACPGSVGTIYKEYIMELFINVFIGVIAFTIIGAISLFPTMVLIEIVKYIHIKD